MDCLKNLVLTLFLALISSKIYAFKLTPMTNSLVLDGRAKNTIFNIVNEGDKPIAIQIHLNNRVMDEWGKETNSEAGEEFAIYPPQLIVKPNETRAVKVTYIDKDVVTMERAYRFVAEQLPIDMARKDKEKLSTNIKILLKYRAAFYLTPKDGKAEITLENASPMVDKGTIEVSLLNKGNIHYLFKKYQLEIKDGEKKVLMEKDNLPGMWGENILAGKKRRFKIKLPKEFAKSESVKVSLVPVE